MQSTLDAAGAPIYSAWLVAIHQFFEVSLSIAAGLMSRLVGPNTSPGIWI